jgi:hypothetical protein
LIAAARPGGTRRVDTIAKLEATHADVWVATASGAGAAHLIPLSYAWDGERVVLALPADSPTIRNLRSSAQVRLGFGPTRDVVMVDGSVEQILEVGSAAAADIAERYACQADWDPRESAGAYLYVLVRPQRIQAWRESNELAGRLLMRDGEWVV